MLHVAQFAHCNIITYGYKKNQCRQMPSCHSVSPEIDFIMLKLPEDQGREMFYLTTHSHFNLRLYGVIHMVKDHSDSEETRCRHMGYSLRLTAGVLLYAQSHRQDSTYHSHCYTSRGALEREIAQCVHHMEGSIRRPIVP